MAAKAWSTQQKTVEEVFFQNDAVSLCLLINRRAKTMRVVDFRAGPTNAKRQFVLQLAKREGMEKAYTLVERDEVQTWVKLGFAKEGNIPGFYKRSDAFLLGCSVNAALAKEPPREVPMQSEIRISLRGRLAHTTPIPPPILEEEEEEVEEPEIDSAHLFAEKTLVHAKKQAKDLADKPLPPAKVTLIREAEAKKPLEKALKAGRALSAFEPFGRDVERRFFMVTCRGGFELVASTESQSCFGNAFLELLTGPKNEAEKLPMASALRALCDKLMGEGVVSCFSLGPSDDVALACTFVANGFRRTGLLRNHMVVGGERKDAIIWSRKLANPADE
ncbi:MAG TPA: hypothetical protein VGI39_41340 [Polyangiaceae bacterium]|jgi:hypothetical protein